ncbi:MAG: VWA domain-containing protein [Cyanobacteria bacterium SZAS LIN-3]|nr:VWA domain-containing protein [Cyanobacteria bacterium SZAS LIN-3]MBS2010728.1 VWA domain-containing protein [Cyanobacteria bacterium SZAS TMP-1]
MNFIAPLLLALVPVALVLLFLHVRRSRAFGHSQVSTQKDLRTFSLIGRLPIFAFGAVLMLLLIALARPVVPELKQFQTLETRDIYIAVDISGSMTSEVTDPNQAALAGSSNTAVNQPPSSVTSSTPVDPAKKLNRLDVAQKAIEMFVPLRKGDRVGLLYFDDEAYVSWPLTTDLDILLKYNKRTNGYRGGGTNFQGPWKNESNYGPIQTAIDNFDDLGQAKSKVIIMVTDGEANIDPDRMADFLEQAKARNLRIYVVGIGEGWVNASSSTGDLRKLAESTGGKIIGAGSAAEILAGMAEINNLEKSRVEVAQSTSFKDIFGIVLLLAIVFGVVYHLSEIFVRKGV